MHALGNNVQTSCGYVSRLTTLGCFLSPTCRQGVLAAHYGSSWKRTQTAGSKHQRSNPALNPSSVFTYWKKAADDARYRGSPAYLGEVGLWAAVAWGSPV